MMKPKPKGAIVLKTPSGKAPKGEVPVYMPKSHAREEKMEYASGKPKPGAKAKHK